jgi:hypothetical protein
MVIQASSILWMSLVAQSGMLVQVATIDQQRTPRRTSQISICVLVQDFVMPSNVLRSLCPCLRLAAQVQEGGQQLPCGRGPRGDVELDVAPTRLLYVNTSLYIGSSSSSSSSSSVFSAGLIVRVHQYTYKLYSWCVCFPAQQGTSCSTPPIV